MYEVKFISWVGMEWLLVLLRIFRVDILFFKEEVWWMDFILWNVLGEFKFGRIFFLSLLLYMLLFVNVVLVFNVVFDNDENVLFFWGLRNLLDKVIEIVLFLELIVDVVFGIERGFWLVIEWLWFDWYWYLKCMFSFFEDFFFFWIFIILLCFKLCFVLDLFFLLVSIEFFV